MAFFLRESDYNFSMPFSDPSHRKPKSPPADSTNEEAAYLKNLAEKQKPVTIKLVDGEVVDGWIEYYDLNMIRLTRDGQPNLFIFKNQIAYVAEGSS
jgi:host factor-I protein